MPMKFKLTTEKMQTWKGFQWELGKWVKTSGEGPLCKDGWVHCYDDPLLAIFLNPIHANIINPRMWVVECRGKMENDLGLKRGYTEMRLKKEIDVPVVSDEQRVKFGVLSSLEVCNEANYVAWANGWLDGSDRTEEAARAAEWAVRTEEAGWAARAAARAVRTEETGWAAAAAEWAAAAEEAAEAKKGLNLIKIARLAVKA